MRKVNEKGLTKAFDTLKKNGEGCDSFKYKKAVVHIRRNSPMTGSERADLYYKRHPEKRVEKNKNMREKYLELKEK